MLSGETINSPVVPPKRRRLLKIFSWFAVLCQVVAASILMSLGFSRGYYQGLSEATTGTSEKLFNSLLLDTVISQPFAYISAGLAVATVLKEFLIKRRATRVKINVISLITMLLFLGLVLSVLYQPI